MILNNKVKELIDKAKKIIVIQAENPDGDSLGSSLALEEILGDMGKAVSLYCPVQIPTYMRYIKGWDRVSMDFDNTADLAIIVDTSAKLLLSKTLNDPIASNFLFTKPSLTLDHHVGVEPDLPFKTEYIFSDTAVSTGELIYDLAKSNNWKINSAAATNLYISIQADSLGLTTSATTADSFEACANLVRLGANPSDIENDRRELMKKSARVLSYKGRLISRIEYYNDSRTAVIVIPFDEIQNYSNEYNPTMLVLDEMRLVTGVDVAVGIKIYPDGKLTGKLRSNIPVSNLIAKTFGGDGHPFAAGFRIYDDLINFMPELIETCTKIYADYDKTKPIKEVKPKVKSTASKKDNPNQIGSFRVKRAK